MSLTDRRLNPLPATERRETQRALPPTKGNRAPATTLTSNTWSTTHYSALNPRVETMQNFGQDSKD